MHAEVDNEEGGTLAVCKVCVEMYGIMHNVRSGKKLRSGFERGKH